MNLRRKGWIALALALPAAVWAIEGIEAKIRFADVTQKAGVQVVHHTRHFKGPTADVLRMFTSGGSSAAVGDYDGDGFDDIFVTDSDSGKPNHLFHNNGNMTFTDVAVAAGVAKGNDPDKIVADALWFDYDNDGREDLLVARFGTPLLYHNEGNGKFKDVTATSGFTKFGNTIAAVAFDYDNDGLLDVMFGNYFKPVNLLDGKDPHVLPNDLDNAVNGGGVTLWHNTGNGHFVDVTEKAGFGKHTGWTLDIGHGDFNNDGYQDVYLACDYGTDRIYFNNGDGTFTEKTETATGFDTRKGMNADVADYDNDGWLDIYVTNITDEYMKECNMLWHNNHDGTFTDVSRETNTCETLWGWSAKFGDFDNDGWKDLFVVDGLRSAGKDNYIPVLVNLITQPGVDFTDARLWPNIGNMSWSGYQKKKMFRNLGGQAFKEISAEAGVDNDKDGRGIGMADFDNDGRLDLYQANADQMPYLYRGVTEGGGNWVQFKLTGTKSNRDAIGARITLKAGGLTQIHEIDGGNGYAGQSTKRAHLGIGKASKVDSVEVHWPSGLVESFDGVQIDKLNKLTEGGGHKQAPWKVAQK
ncbi:MAG TPA: CRTAC1 family protein [Bryobacteraceae bacterium]|nr:CRTAC1 family protein [Bryobacteraceae bacterium]